MTVNNFKKIISKQITLANITYGFILSLGLIMIIRNFGVWLMPNLSVQFQISQSLAHNTLFYPEQHYLYTNYLQPAIFGLLGFNKFRYYVVYTTLITVLFVALFSVWFIHHHGQKIAINEMKLFTALTFPVFAIPFYWIGMDGMTLLLMLFISINLSSRWVILSALLLGIQHFEQGLLAFILLGISILLSVVYQPYDLIKTEVRKILIILLGIVLGKVILTAWFWVMNVELMGSRTEYLESYVNLFIAAWFQFWPFIGWSFLGVSWLILIKKIKILWPFLTVSAIAFFFTAIVADQTRVGTIILFPSLFYWILRNKALWQKMNIKLSVALIILYLILPAVVVWGKPYGSLREYNVQIIQQILQGDVTLEKIDWMQPFQNQPFIN